MDGVVGCADEVLFRFVILSRIEDVCRSVNKDQSHPFALFNGDFWTDRLSPDPPNVPPYNF